MVVYFRSGVLYTSAMKAYLSMGSNVGDRLAALRRGLRLLASQQVGKVCDVSRIYETEPMYVAGQGMFLNMVCLLETQLSPEALLKEVKQIEKEVGRVETYTNGPRVLDVDMLMYENVTMCTSGLVLPHPRMHERAFVLVPLCEIAPHLVHPVLQKNIRQLCASVENTGVKPGRMLARVVEKGGENESVKEFVWGERTYVMGIVNCTPDSFSGDGVMANDDWIGRAVKQAEQMVQDGADMVDIGGESTRPGAAFVGADEEISRVVPVIEKLIERGLRVPISIDTYKAEVAEAALRAGASMVNDVWGLARDNELGKVVAHYGVPVVLMHNREARVDASQTAAQYTGEYGKDMMADVKRELLEAVARAEVAGIAHDKIILDSGIGFAKNREQSLEVVARHDELRMLGYPLLAGPSRKSFIGNTLGVGKEERLEGTLAVCTMLCERGANILRVHDVKEVVRAVRMSETVRTVQLH